MKEKKRTDEESHGLLSGQTSNVRPCYLSCFSTAAPLSLPPPTPSLSLPPPTPSLSPSLSLSTYSLWSISSILHHLLPLILLSIYFSTLPVSLHLPLHMLRLYSCLYTCSVSTPACKFSLSHSIYFLPRYQILPQTVLHLSPLHRLACCCPVWLALKYEL